MRLFARLDNGTPITGTQWLVQGASHSFCVAQAEAAADFMLRYCRHAKDSAARRIGGLSTTKLRKGSKATQLP